MTNETQPQPGISDAELEAIHASVHADDAEVVDCLIAEIKRLRAAPSAGWIEKAAIDIYAAYGIEEAMEPIEGIIAIIRRHLAGASVETRNLWAV